MKESDFMNIIRIVEALKKEENNNCNNLLFQKARNGDNWRKVKEEPYYKEMLDTIYADAEKYMKGKIKTLPFVCTKFMIPQGHEKSIRRNILKEEGD